MEILPNHLRYAGACAASKWKGRRDLANRTGVLTKQPLTPTNILFYSVLNWLSGLPAVSITDELLVLMLYIATLMC